MYNACGLYSTLVVVHMYMYMYICTYINVVQKSVCVSSVCMRVYTSHQICTCTCMHLAKCTIPVHSALKACRLKIQSLMERSKARHYRAIWSIYNLQMREREICIETSRNERSYGATTHASSTYMHVYTHTCMYITYMYM